MEFTSKHNKGRDTLKDIITFFGCTIPHLPEVKLDKLVYIAQLYHYSNYGELLTGTRFFSLSYGPHAPAIRFTVEEQLARDAIYLERSRTSADPTYSNPVMIIRSCESKDSKLPPSCLNTLREVVQDWGEKNFKDILHYTTRTIPFLSTSFREHIDLTTIDRFHGLKHALSLPQRVRIHRFVEANDEGVGQDIAYCESCPASINEVVEIYLALRGDPPEDIPSREYLGFDAQAVLEAFASVDDRKKERTGKQANDIDNAAQLTYSLINSMSFKHYSARVALTTGILLLKRSGYSFTKDTLEENWPQGTDYETLRAWFKGVSEKIF